jgi:uncharacterized membrane protein
MRHPLHPALVHFPVACWTLATVGDFASLFWGEAAWRPAGLLLAAGTLLAVPAMLAGMLELAQVPPGGNAIKDVYRHMAAMLLALTLYGVALLLRLDHLGLTAPGAAILALEATGFLAVAVGGWLGGNLVYQHGIGGNRSSRSQAPTHASP